MMPVLAVRRSTASWLSSHSAYLTAALADPDPDAFLVAVKTAQHAYTPALTTTDSPSPCRF